jgi:hypothetical protein
MDNPETMATLGTQDTGQRQKVKIMKEFVWINRKFF